jgi:hypothetical protein
MRMFSGLVQFSGVSLAIVQAFRGYPADRLCRPIALVFCGSQETFLMPEGHLHAYAR